jgi:hypothetical protein
LPDDRFIWLLNTFEVEMGRKQEKAEQRKNYKETFKKMKHGHGGRSIRKKEESALGG